ncbi:MAG: VCBS domain-containing protein, partial [Candidatus Puniceispirillales bacterium WSBS_2018_MAG_OTU23]
VSGNGDTSVFGLRLRTGQSLDFEDVAEYALTFTYDDTTPSSLGTVSAVSDAVTITVTNVNDVPPMFTSDASGVAFDEGTLFSLNALVYTAAATADTDVAVVYSLEGADSDQFVIDADTGAVTFAEATTLDFETTPSYVFTVRATAGGQSSTQAVTLAVTDVVEVPTTIALGTSSVTLPEGDFTAPHDLTTVALAGTEVGGYVLSLAGNDDRFELINGVLRITAGASFDFEADSGSVVQVIVRADGPSSITETFSLTLTDANDAPEIIVTSNEEHVILEGVTGLPATMVSNLQPILFHVVDEDINAPAVMLSRFTISSATQGVSDPEVQAIFTVYYTNPLDFLGGASGAIDDIINFGIRHKTGVNLDFETHGPIYNVRVTYNDGELTSAATPSFQIRVNDVEEGSRFINSSVAVPFAEGVELDAGTAVYTAAAIPVIGGQAVTYSILGGADAGLFTIDSTTGVVTLAAAITPNFVDNSDGYTFAVGASAGGETTPRDVTIAITPIITKVFYSFTFSSGADTIVEADDVTAQDLTTLGIEGGIALDGYVFTISDDRFEIINGILRIVEGADFDFDSSATVNVDISGRKIDATTNALASGTYTLHLTNVAEAPTITSGGTGLTVIDGDTYLDTDVLYTATAIPHPNFPTDDITYSIGRHSTLPSVQLDPTDHLFFAIDSATGEVTFATNTFEANHDDSIGSDGYQFAVVATSRGESTRSDVTIDITPVDEHQPSFLTGDVTGAITTASDTRVVTGVVGLTVDRDTLPAHKTTIVTLQTPLNGQYGTISFVDNAWTYTLYAEDALSINVGAEVTDKFVVYGTNDIRIRITGGNNVPEITITEDAGTVQENAVAANIDAIRFTVFDQNMEHQNYFASRFTVLSSDPLAINNADVQALFKVYLVEGTGVTSVFGVKLKEGQTLDYEGITSYGLKFTYRDDLDEISAESGVVTVAVTNVNEQAPQFTSSAIGAPLNDGLSLTANSNIYIAEVTGVEADRVITYRLEGDDAELFTIDDTGILHFAEATEVDFETRPDGYSLTIIASSDGLSTSLELTIAITDRAEAPQFVIDGTSVAADAIDEGLAFSTDDVLYTAAATPIISGQAVTYAIDGVDREQFNINSEGEITFATATTPDHTTNSDGYRFTVIATAGGEETLQTVTIAITPIGGQTTAIAGDLTGDTVVSLSATWVVMGVLQVTGSAVDVVTPPDSLIGTYGAIAFNGNTWTYTLDTADADTMAISGDAAVLDSFTVSVGAITQQIVISITASDNPPMVVIDVGAGTAIENADGVNIDGIRLRASDTDLSDQNYAASGFTLLSADTSTINHQAVQDLFEVYLLSGTEAASVFGVKVKDGQSLDFEDASSYGLKFTYGNGRGVSAESSTVSIAVTNVVEAPSFTADTLNTVLTDGVLVSAGTALYEAAATPAITGQDVTYSLTGISADLFDIDVSGVVRFKVETEADHDTNQDGYRFTIAAVAGSEETRQDVTIAITPVDEHAPTIGGVTTGMITAINEFFVASGQLTVTGDIDSPEHRTTVIDQTGSIMGVYGNIDFVGSGVWFYNFNIEDTQFLNVGETVTDSFTVTAGAATADIVVTIMGINDAPTVTIDRSVGGVAENTDGANIQGIRLRAVDPDTNDQNYAASGFTVLSANTGVISDDAVQALFEVYLMSGTGDTSAFGVRLKTGVSLNPETAASYGLTFSYNDGDVESAVSSAITITVTGANIAPTGQDNEVDITGTTYSFAAADFAAGFVDTNVFTGITILSLPSSGALMLNDVAVTQDQSIDAVDIAGLVYTLPSVSSRGDSNTFEYSVSDGGLNSAPYTFTVNNIAPSTSLVSTSNPQFAPGHTITGTDNADIRDDSADLSGNGFRYNTGLGDDSVIGSGENDIFNLGSGDDTATGGGGEDTFFTLFGVGEKTLTITDFEFGRDLFVSFGTRTDFTGELISDGVNITGVEFTNNANELIIIDFADDSIFAVADIKATLGLTDDAVLSDYFTDNAETTEMVEYVFTAAAFDPSILDEIFGVGGVDFL